MGRKRIPFADEVADATHGDEAHSNDYASLNHGDSAHSEDYAKTAEVPDNIEELSSSNGSEGQIATVQSDGSIAAENNSGVSESRVEEITLRADEGFAPGFSG